MKVESAAKQLEALGNSTRLQVYRSLVRAGDAGLPVGRLQEKLKIAASTLSHHLHRLILTGLVTQERQGTTLICRANYPAMRSLLGFLADECCADGVCVTEVSERRHERLFCAHFFDSSGIMKGSRHAPDVSLIYWLGCARSHSIGAELARWRAGTTTNSPTSVLFEPKCQALSGRPGRTLPRPCGRTAAGFVAIPSRKAAAR